MSVFVDPVLPAIFDEKQQGIRQFDKDLVAAISNWGLFLKSILDHGLFLADNADAVVSSYTSNAIADTEDTVAHTLGRIPTYFVVADINKAGVVYRTATAFTKTQAFLKCSTASTALKIIFF